MIRKKCKGSWHKHKIIAYAMESDGFYDFSKVSFVTIKIILILPKEHPY